MTDNLKIRAASAMFWSLAEHVGVQGLRFVISIVLARMLLPEEFGLVTLLVLFMALADSIVDSGFGTALVQRKELTKTDECSVFYLNLGIGVLVATLLWFAAPWIAIFFRTPELVSVARAFSIIPIIRSFGIVQRSLLTRSIDFRTQAKVSLWATPVSGCIAIGMAYSGWGVWSLVAQLILRSILGQILLWSLCSWRPSLQFSVSSLRSMFSFGSRVFIMGIVDTLFKNIYLVVIGRLFSPADLGFYGRADSTQQLPALTLSRIVRRVTLPVFSSIQDDKKRLAKSVQRILRVMVFINFPAMVGIAATAQPLVLVLFTEKWAESIPYLQLLAAVGMLYPLHAINRNVLLAQGHSDLCLRIEMIKKALIVVAVLVSFPFGIKGLICGQIVQSSIAYFINSYYTGKLLGYTSKDQLVDCVPYLGTTLAMGIVVYTIQFLPIDSNLLILTLQVGGGVLIYVGLSYVLRLSAWLEAQAMIENWWQQRRTPKIVAMKDCS